MQETKEFLVENDITNVSQYSKKQWKNMIDDLISQKNRREILTKMRTKSKIRHGSIMNEEYELKSYLTEMNVEQARTKYRERYSMLKFCKINFFNDPLFKKEEYKCSFCPSISSQSHLYFCPKYEEIRRCYNNLEDDIDAVNYIIDVMKLNAEIEEDDTN